MADIQDFTSEPLAEFRLGVQYHRQEYSDWQCVPFGISGGDRWIIRPAKGCEPNWFWRWMQYLAFGNRWTRMRRDG